MEETGQWRLAEVEAAVLAYGFAYQELEGRWLRASDGLSLRIDGEARTVAVEGRERTSETLSWDEAIQRLTTESL